MKNESKSFKRNYIGILNYFVFKYSKDIVESNKRVREIASNLLDEDLSDLNMNYNFKLMERNNLYLYRYRGYLEKLEKDVLEVVYKPEKILLKELEYYKKKALPINNKTNKSKKILISATMSSGKSTIVNAIIGHKVVATKNDSCTAKVTKIIEDQKIFDGVICETAQMRLKIKKDIPEVIHTIESDILSIRSKMNHLPDNLLWELIDTPGINSSMDPKHKELTKNVVLKGQYDILLYVINSNHIGTFDDVAYLKFIQKHVENSKVIFVLNKVDQFRKGSDSIINSVNKLKKDLFTIGFKNPIIYPLSAYAGYLSKQPENELDEDALDELYVFKRKFQKFTYNLTGNIEKKEQNLTANCGLLALENEIKRRMI